MKAKKQRKPRVDAADVAMQDVSKSQPKHPKKSPSKASKPQPNAADKVTKFKEEQRLKIETLEVGEVEAEPDEEKAAPPSSSSKKRRRRSAAEIDRKFKCPFVGCSKAYGSEGSLIHHQRLKHPEQVEAQEQETQVGTFLLPLYNAPRNVSIRPATPLVAFASDPNLVLSNRGTNDLTAIASPSEIVPPSAKASRHNLRSRSNSEPVALIDEVAIPRVSIPAPSSKLPMKPRAKTPRKPRRVSTPHPRKVAIAARRTKLRSKSESLPEMNPFQPLDELKIPSYRRSVSAASAHAAIFPISSTGSDGRGSFEWPSSLISASGHHSASLSSDEQAIDSDILSVLANCDADDIGDPSVLDFGGGPPSTSSYQSNTSFGESEDAEMLPVGMECFKIAEHATLPTEVSRGLAMNEPETELGLNAFATLGDDWANALHLSNHLEKMSMAQGDTPPHSLGSTFGTVLPGEGTVDRLRSASDPVHAAAPIHPGLSHFSSMPQETFSVKATNQSAADNELVSPHNANLQQWFGSSSATEAAKVEDSNMQQMLWLSSETGVANMGKLQPSSETLDELLQHDDTLEWKPVNGFEGGGEVEYALGDAGIAPTLL